MSDCPDRIVDRGARGPNDGVIGRPDFIAAYPRSLVRTIFTLASGRSSTRFLYEIITRNALDVVATHEPYVSNPSMFGPAVYAHASGDKTYLRALLERKRRAIMCHAP